MTVAEHITTEGGPVREWPDEKDGAVMIAAERARQIAKGGWTPEHDDEHRGGELLAAALVYAEHRSGSDPAVPSEWPWEPSCWKPREPIENLVRAGALIAAEIDRLNRRCAAVAASPVIPAPTATELQTGIGSSPVGSEAEESCPNCKGSGRNPWQAHEPNPAVRLACQVCGGTGGRPVGSEARLTNVIDLLESECETRTANGDADAVRALHDAMEVVEAITAGRSTGMALSCAPGGLTEKYAAAEEAKEAQGTGHEQVIPAGRNRLVVRRTDEGLQVSFEDPTPASKYDDLVRALREWIADNTGATDGHGVTFADGYVSAWYRLKALLDEHTQGHEPTPDKEQT